jgi:hypothetical protein
LEPEQLAFLRVTARKTWRFFETFVTEQENWLPPDNFQESPVLLVAARTSPTNMGLALLANLAAWDFGYLSVGQLMQRTQNTLGTMQRLERHRGHFFNWYKTRTLEVLQPRYISSVDSGNLAGHLMTLGPGLAELPAQTILAPQLFAGLRDTAGILKGLAVPAAERLQLERLEAELAKPPSTLRAAFDLLQQTTNRAAAIAVALGNQADEELKWWGHALERNCRDHLEDFAFPRAVAGVVGRGAFHGV